MVASLQEFWPHYSLLEPGDRCYYEILREREPCHLYFDLEFLFALNPECNGDHMVRVLVARVQRALLVRFGVVLRDEAVVHLCSSSEKKFSRHLICHLEGCLFGAFLSPLVSDLNSAPFYSHGLSTPTTADSVQCGHFVRRLCANLELEARAAESSAGTSAATAPEHDVRCLLVRIDAEAPTRRALFVDTGVYTKNRVRHRFLLVIFGDALTPSSPSLSHPAVSHVPFEQARKARVAVPR